MRVCGGFTHRGNLNRIHCTCRRIEHGAVDRNWSASSCKHISLSEQKQASTIGREIPDGIAILNRSQRLTLYRVDEPLSEITYGGLKLLDQDCVRQGKSGV